MSFPYDDNERHRWATSDAKGNISMDEYHNHCLQGQHPRTNQGCFSGALNTSSFGSGQRPGVGAPSNNLVFPHQHFHGRNPSGEVDRCGGAPITHRVEGDARSPGAAGNGEGLPLEANMDPNATTAMLDACIRDLSRRRLAMAEQAARTASAVAAMGPGTNQSSNRSIGNRADSPSLSGRGSGGRLSLGLADYAGTAADSFAQAFVDRWASVHAHRGSYIEKDISSSVHAKAMIKGEPSVGGIGAIPGHRPSGYRHSVGNGHILKAESSVGGMGTMGGHHGPMPSISPGYRNPIGKDLSTPTHVKAIKADPYVCGIGLTGCHRGSVSSILPEFANPIGRRNSEPSMPNSISKQWWVCDFCKKKAFMSRDELREHELSCESNLNVYEGHSQLRARMAQSDVKISLPNGGSAMCAGTASDLNSPGGIGVADDLFSGVNTKEGVQMAFQTLRQPRKYSHNNPTFGMNSGVSRVGMGGGESFDLSLGGISPNRGVYVDEISRGGSYFASNLRRVPLPDKADPSLAQASKGPFTTLDEPIPLAMDEDKDWLTPLHCFVRRHCVQVFTATHIDVQTPSKGKRKPIQVGQVGIRCPHCHKAKKKDDASRDGSLSASRERGSVYYPTSLSSIYNATMNLLQRHLHSCPSVPKQIMERYCELKLDDARSGTSKKYWIESAKSLGFVDTLSGIKLSANCPPPPPAMSNSQLSEGMNSRVRRNSEDFYSNESNAITSAKGGKMNLSSPVENKPTEKKSDEYEERTKKTDREAVANASPPSALDDNVESEKPGNNDNEKSKHEDSTNRSQKNKLDDSSEASGIMASTENEVSESKDQSEDTPEKAKTVATASAGEKSSDAPPLVIPADKSTATEFSFLLLSQMQPCVFTEADRLGKRKGLPTGFAGLACRHCFGGYGSGRFFPSSIKTLSDTSKTLNVLHNHMTRCRKCPKDIRDKLEKARMTHDDERAKMKFGSQKAFFAKIWGRLHDNRPDGCVLRSSAPSASSGGGSQALRSTSRTLDSSNGMMLCADHPDMLSRALMMRQYSDHSGMLRGGHGRGFGPLGETNIPPEGHMLPPREGAVPRSLNSAADHLSVANVHERGSATVGEAGFLSSSHSGVSRLSSVSGPINKRDHNSALSLDLLSNQADEMRKRIRMSDHHKTGI